MVSAKTLAPAAPRRRRATSQRSAAAHDSPYPPALIQFMLQGWQKVKPAPGGSKAVVPARTYRARRLALARAFPGETLIIAAGQEKTRNGDTAYSFRPNSDFLYLTGNDEPGAVLVLWVETPVRPGKAAGRPRAALAARRRGEQKHLLFVEPDEGRSTPTFFTDRHKGQLWVGPRLGLVQSQRRYQVDECLPLGQLAQFLERLMKHGRRGGGAPVRLLRGVDAALDALVPAARPAADAALAVFLAEQRLCKDAAEVAAIERGAAATRRAFADVIAALPRAKYERDVEAVVLARARREGRGVGYPTIAAGGAHACVLHWNRNDGPLKRGQLLLLDAGVETDHYYTADVTRVFPISGQFSPVQRQVYDWVARALSAAVRAVQPGAPFLAPHRAAMQVLAQGLVALGILKTSAAQALEDDKQWYKRYTLHGTSHMLGLDAHDCGKARAEAYRLGVLRPGMVLTVEPGLYFQPDDLTVERRFRGIGIRLEDDVLVTPTGYRVLTDLPRRASAVERWMHTIWQQQQKRSCQHKA